MTLDPGLFGLMLEKMVGMLGEMQKGLNVKGLLNATGERSHRWIYRR